MSEIDELRSLFVELRDILVSEGERSMGRFVEGLCYRLWDDSVVEDLKEIKWSYIDLARSRPFSDFYIPRDRPEESLRLDQVLGRLQQLCD